MKKILNKWTDIKPDYACVFLTRNKMDGKYYYDLWSFRWIDDSSCLAWFKNKDDEVYDDIILINMVADEYMVLEVL